MFYITYIFLKLQNSFQIEITTVRFEENQLFSTLISVRIFWIFVFYQTIFLKDITNLVFCSNWRVMMH